MKTESKRCIVRRNVRSIGLLFGVTLLTVNAGCTAFQAPLSVVEFVELERYAGRWYEIARYPNNFERNCAGVTADYSIRDDGRVNVVNTCFEGSPDGVMRTIEGTARSVDPSNAKLKVTFFWPFEGDYWIMDLDEDYTYAVVGDPSRSFLWILSRTPQLDDTILDAIFEWLPSQGFDPERVIMVEQAAESMPGS